MKTQNTNSKFQDQNPNFSKIPSKKMKRSLENPFLIHKKLDRPFLRFSLDFPPHPDRPQKMYLLDPTSLPMLCGITGALTKSVITPFAMGWGRAYLVWLIFMAHVLINISVPWIL